MERRIAIGIMLALLLISMLTLGLDIDPINAEPEPSIVVGTTDSVELTLDPAQTYDLFGWCILQQIAGTLVGVEPGSATGADYVGELANSWNASEDSMVWDFNLRQGIKFPDGTEFNATHVKYSFDRAIGLIPSIPEGAPAGMGYDLIINHIEALDTHKVRFYLNYPFSPFLGILACRASAIVDPKYAPMAQVNYTAGNARASTTVAFVGPYVLSKWDRVAGRDIEITLDANSNYWNLPIGYPKLKHIVFKFYNDAATLRLAIEAGDVDMALRHISPTDVLDLEKNPNVRVWWGSGAQIQYFCFQEKRAPFNDTRVRVAVAAALNRMAVTETVFLGLAKPLYSIIPPGMLGHTEAFKDAGLDANYTLTRSLLTDAGYSPSNPLTFDLWYESSGHYPSSEDQALLYKEAIEAAWPGAIQVTLKSADWASYKKNRDDEIMDAYVYGWYPDYVDPDDYSFLYWASWLHTNYSNATQVALFDQARTTTNTTLRAQLYAQIDDIAVEQCSVVPLWVSSAWVVTKPTIYGVYLDITQDMRYWLIYSTEMLIHDIAVTSVVVSPTTVMSGEPVTITVVVKNQGVFTETFSVTAYYDDVAIGTMTMVDLAPSSSKTLSFTWNTSGVAGGAYVIRAVASSVSGEVDAANNVFVDGLVTVIVDTTAPIASFTYRPTEPDVGEIVTLDASASTDNIGIVTYEWDFGDGTKATGMIVTHAYTESGSYNVRLTVLDAAGNACSTSATITVGKVLSIELSGEFDYMRAEQVSIRLAALVRDAETMEPVSNALVNVEIYNDAGNLWVSAIMQEEILGSGIYEWKSAGTIGQLRLSKGVYLVRASASFRDSPVAYDILLFHIDPPLESEAPPSTPLLYYATVIALIAGTTIGIALLRRHRRQELL